MPESVILRFALQCRYTISLYSSLEELPDAHPDSTRHRIRYPELSRLVAALAAWEQSVDPRVQFDWDGIRDAPNWLKLVLNRGHHAVWVASSDGRLVGHLWIRLKRNSDGALPQSIGYISQAFMDENFRGRGLMKPMLEAAYEWFRDAGITVVTLSVLHRNWVGATAWHRLGFSDWREERRMDLKPRPK